MALNQRNRTLMLIPVNGIGNRIRAIASAALISQVTGMNLRVLWEPEPMLPGSWEEVFQANNPVFSFVQDDSHSNERLAEKEQIPLYVGETADFVYLRGYDKGEQRFAREFLNLIRKSNSKNAVIVAGGLFHPGARNIEQASSKLVRMRRRVLTSLTFTNEVQDRVKNLTPDSRFIGLSIRGTDLIEQFPGIDSAVAATVKLARRTASKDVFLSTDDNVLVEAAHQELVDNGFRVHRNSQGTWTRHDSKSIGFPGVEAREALSEMLVMSRATAFAASKSSSFSTEIATQFSPLKRILF
jgi:hypothetical protein